MTAGASELLDQELCLERHIPTWPSPCVTLLLCPDSCGDRPGRCCERATVWPVGRQGGSVLLRRLFCPADARVEDHGPRVCPGEPWRDPPIEGLWPCRCPWHSPGLS